MIVLLYIIRWIFHFVRPKIIPAIKYCRRVSLKVASLEPDPANNFTKYDVIYTNILYQFLGLMVIFPIIILGSLLLLIGIIIDGLIIELTYKLWNDMIYQQINSIDYFIHFISKICVISIIIQIALVLFNSKCNNKIINILIEVLWF